MFIFIFEDGSIGKSTVCSEADKEVVKDGYLDIIDISDPEMPMRCHVDGHWYNDIEEWPTQ